MKIAEVSWRIKRIIVVLLLIFISFHATHAQVIEEYRVEVDIKDILFRDIVLHERISMTLVNNHDSDITKFTYPFNSRLEDIKVYDARGELLETTTEFKGGKTYITYSFKEPLEPNESTTITYDFLTNLVVSKQKNTYSLTTAYFILANVEDFELVITLPEGAGLPEEGVNVVPRPQAIYSDGRHVILKWKEKNPAGFEVYVRYEKFYSQNYLRYAIALIISALAVFLLYKKRIFSYRRKGVSEKIDILKEDEQRILKLVMEENGIDQRKIQDQTDFSKAKVSKILSELEKRGAIRKEQIGRRNKIYLAEKLKK